MKTIHIMCMSKTDIYVSQNKEKKRKYFCQGCLQYFSSKNMLTEHVEVCLSINGAQSVRL